MSCFLSADLFFVCAVSGCTDHGAVQPYGEFLIPVSGHFTADYAAVLPFRGYRKPAPRTESGERSVRQGIGKCREDVDQTVVALEKHLRDAGSSAEISVNLERRMIVEHIGRGAFFRRAMMFS
jgi:hypothetical protein